MMKRLFKIRSIAGVRCLGPNPYAVKSVGYSKIDGYPVFEMTLEQGIGVNFEWFARSFVINGRPGYTIQKEDIELIHSIEDVSSHIPGLTGASWNPVAGPATGKLYYIEKYEYPNESDERLNLLL